MAEAIGSVNAGNTTMIGAEGSGGLFGRLTWQDSPLVEVFQDPNASTLVGAGAAGVTVAGTVVVAALLTRFRLWGPLWRNWLVSTDHKRVGIMYVVVALVMLTRGVIEGSIMRLQQMLGLSGGFLAPDHFSQLFTTHGTIMIFFVAMPLVVGVINYVLPLQIGARDVAFPVMNQTSLALTAAGAVLLMVSLVIGQFSTGGWTAYPPYTGKAFQPGVGPDYWIWAILFSGVGNTLAGINIAVTIFKQRAPGMTFLRMPLFCWTVLCMAIMTIFAMPALTVAAVMLAADRYLDFHFFTNDLGGNLMNYANLFWLFGHPEVYILVLPAYGVFSSVFSTFSGKKLYGYTSLVIATCCIAVLSFTVWLHHFFTMGQGANVNIAFGIATMIIAVPTGVKVYDWMATMYRGRIRISAAMAFALGFMLLFVIGGLTGVILANPTLDYQVHNSVFLVAHFHNVLIPGVLFGMLAAINHWFPKAFGFRLHHGWGVASALLWSAGFMLTFFPLYFLGLMGLPRRSWSYDDPAFDPYTLVAMGGALCLLGALASLMVQIYVSIRERRDLAAPIGDPWNGLSLEWSTPSPPPAYNFAVLPCVHGRDAWAHMKAQGTAYDSPAPEDYQDIRVPRDSVFGIAVCLLTVGLAFGLTWYMWWMAWLCAGLMLVLWIGLSFRLESYRTISAYHVRREYETWLERARATEPVSRDAEFTARNCGRAIDPWPEAN